MELFKILSVSLFHHKDSMIPYSSNLHLMYITIHGIIRSLVSVL